MINLHEQTGPDRSLAETRIADASAPGLFYHGLEYTPPARGTWTIAHTPMLVPGAHEIYVCPQSCLRGVSLSAAEFDGLDRFHMIVVKESDLTTTKGMESLFIDGVADILDHLSELPPCVFLFTSCLHHFLGTDTREIFRKIRARYPSVDFVEASMNCTLRNSKRHFEEATNSALYGALYPRPQNPKSVDLVGNYYAVDPDSELVFLLDEAGFTVRDLCRTQTYEDYQEMADASFAVYTHFMGKLSAEDLHDRFGMTPIAAPYSWDPLEITESLQAVSSATGAPVPDLSALRTQAEMAFEQLRASIGNVEIQIDAAGTPRPFQLARLLLQKGFCVTTVYTDAVLPGDSAAFEALRTEAPDLVVRAMTHFALRTWDYDDASKADGRLLAIGQKAAYFSGTKHFVNLIYNSGLWGFTGMVKLCALMEDAMRNETETRDVIQVKAWGCHG